MDVLLAAAHPGEAEGPELSEEQQELLAELEKKIDEAMEGFGEGKGGCVKINTRYARLHCCQIFVSGSVVGTALRHRKYSFVSRPVHFLVTQRTVTGLGK